MGAIGNRFPRQKIRWVDFTWTVHPGTLHFCEQFVLSEMYGSTGDTRTPHFLEWGVPYPHFLGVWQKNNSDFPSYSAHVSPYNIQENVWRLGLCPRNRVRAHITRPTSSYLRNRISTARIAHIPCTQRQIHNKYNSIHDSAVHKVDSNMFWPWWRADHDPALHVGRGVAGTCGAELSRAETCIRSFIHLLQLGIVTKPWWRSLQFRAAVQTSDSTSKWAVK